MRATGVRFLVAGREQPSTLLRAAGGGDGRAAWYGTSSPAPHEQMAVSTVSSRSRA
ncbi:hypothetical protein ABZ446_46685 [Streptomyces sp. NPDC005813]|uniref:hypothetical protein n=1 Tax=Streptomyces sp. NPDC005813 TaxID=3155592 RepID=UPI0033FD7556